MDVQLPDGTILRDVPEGTTKAQIAEKLKANGRAVPAEWLGPSARVSSADQPGMLKSAAAGIGKGVGQVALNAQKLVGMGIEKLGGGSAQTVSDLVVPGAGGNAVQRAGRWLQSDAESGLRKIEGELEPYKQANPISAGVGEFGGQLVATAPVGGLIAGGLSRVPGFATAAPNLVQAIRTSGMSAGNASGVSNAIARALGGGVTGGASAALVNPDDAATGAAIGAALPSVLGAAGRAGNAIGRLLRGPEQAPDLAAAVQAAQSAGYVIPPTQARATLGNRLLEGFSGKITTAQNASAKNQAVTNAKAAQALGLAPDVKMTPDVLKTVRDQAGQAYDAIGDTGMVQAPASYMAALDKIAAPFVKTAQSFPGAKPSPVLELVDSLKSPSFDAAAAVEKIKQLRSAADDAFRSGSPGATDLARASRSAAGALEDALEAHLQQIGQPQLLQAFRDSRQLIAKTYSVEKALNPTTGAVDARKLASQLQKGKPLSGELKDAAEFAARFPKAAQTVEQMGSLPQMSPLDWAAGGGMAAATANPLMLASVMARPAARALTLSPIVQNRLTQPAPNALSALLADPRAVQLGYRAAPIALTDR